MPHPSAPPDFRTWPPKDIPGIEGYNPVRWPLSDQWDRPYRAEAAAVLRKHAPKPIEEAGVDACRKKLLEWFGLPEHADTSAGMGIFYDFCRNAKPEVHGRLAQAVMGG